MKKNDSQIRLSTRDLFAATGLQSILTAIQKFTS